MAVAAVVRLLVAIAACVSGVSVGTTTADAAGCSYDAHANAHVDTRAASRVEARPTKLNDVREGSASPLSEVRGASTTPRLAVVATNTASLLSDLARRIDAGGIELENPSTSSYIGAAAGWTADLDGLF